MGNSIFNTKLVEEIQKRMPQKKKLVNELVELLNIEKEAVYRRLRGEVAFSMHETGLIAQHFSISIDTILGTTFPNLIRLNMRLMEFNNPDDQEYTSMNRLRKFVGSLQAPETEAEESANILPKCWIYPYESLTRFYLFKWYSQYQKTNGVRNYKDIVIPPKMKFFYKRYVRIVHEIRNTRFVLDPQIFERFINDFLYFRSINAISEEEGLEIKKDLHSLLHDLEDLTLSGKYKDTGKQVQIYISLLSFEGNYCYIKTPNYDISFIKSFILNVATSAEPKALETVRNWIHSQLKHSVLITESGEIERIKFFQKQHELIDRM